jgi:hypothetical protein
MPVKSGGSTTSYDDYPSCGCDDEVWWHDYNVNDEGGLVDDGLDYEEDWADCEL